MPASTQTDIPKIRHHKASGRAAVVLDGRWIYLGKFGTEEARQEYERRITEWLANGRRLRSDNDGMPLTELIARYWRFAETYYRGRDGEPSKELSAIRCAMRPLKRLYGRTAASAFGPLALKTVRQTMIETPILPEGEGGSGDSDERKRPTRTQVNQQVGRIKRMFKWAASEELVPASVFHALQSVDGLRRGRSTARESEPVRPVPDEYVDAVLPHVSRQVRAMIEIQRLTGMRSGELVPMRACDIDMTGRLWIYRPERHKTERFGFAREVCLGPRAQAIIRQFLTTDREAYLFRPADAERERDQERRRKRKTRVQPSQAKRKAKSKPKRAPTDCYTSDTYRRAIERACDLADARARDVAPPFRCGQCEREYTTFHYLRRHAEQVHGIALEKPKLEGERQIPRWHPHQLRHNLATRLRREFGIEVARVMLGHASVGTTEIYAERDSKVAREVMGKIG